MMDFADLQADLLSSAVHLRSILLSGEYFVAVVLLLPWFLDGADHGVCVYAYAFCDVRDGAHVHVRDSDAVNDAWYYNGHDRGHAPFPFL